VAFTYFFRDRQTLLLMRDYLAHRLARRDRLYVWDAGCAYGQEPYSLAISLRQVTSAEQFTRIQILATDVDRSGRLAAAVLDACYSRSQVQRIPSELRTAFFAPQPRDPERYVLRADIRASVTFQRHDLCTLVSPGGPFDAVVCKNVLLHLSADLQAEVIRMFHSVLCPGGLLATEQTQKLPASVESLFEPFSGNAQVHRKSDASLGNSERVAANRLTSPLCHHDAASLISGAA